MRPNYEVKGGKLRVFNCDSQQEGLQDIAKWLDKNDREDSIIVHSVIADPASDEGFSFILAYTE